MTLLSVLLATAALHGSVAESWRGEFTLTIKGQGRVANALITGTWKVDRIARGTVVLDRTFRGGGIAGTEGTRDTARYETWVATSRLPIEQMMVRDTGSFYGPLFSPKNFRLDTQRWTCPAASRSDAKGQIGSGILQFDYKNGTFTFETPRIFTVCERYHRREFVKGPPEWTAKPPLMLEDRVDLAFEMGSALNSPSEWNQITGPFKAGQTEIVLSRKFAFTWPLQTEMFPGGALDAELVLVLRKAS